MYEFPVDLLMLREAIGSVALEHREDCDCVVCKANSGDPVAFSKIAVTVEQYAPVSWGER